MKTLFLAAALLLSGCATGTTLVTGHARPAVAPEAVQLLLQAPSAPYEVIGAVTSTSQLGMTAQQNQDRAIADARQRAGAMGANAIIIDYVGVPSGNSPVVGAVSGGVVTAIPTSDAGDREIRARAIFIGG